MARPTTETKGIESVEAGLVVALNNLADFHAKFDSSSAQGTAMAIREAASTIRRLENEIVLLRTDTISVLTGRLQTAEARVVELEETLKHHVGNPHDGPCYYCGEPTDSWAANPNVWNVYLPTPDSEPGKGKPHHMRCVVDHLARADRLQAQLALARKEVAVAKDALREIEGGCGHAYNHMMTPDEAGDARERSFFNMRARAIEAIKRIRGIEYGVPTSEHTDT